MGIVNQTVMEYDYSTEVTSTAAPSNQSRNIECRMGQHGNIST